ncbi:SGNH hydrolase domain-containing protein [Aeromicrobium sp. IC_218]|uniref:SGNH hydrolase domain-containing protein n=1 Tax=Aeromicrobium sp. IC_218 TaxID=2545468 RepID=UPI00103EBE81|nr:SGNH hydrolase domain-containing protein [Aeromicrobium sp. IC_218]TCI97374.1 hypothetical protein E0W78_12430 [Aeromicrobium sp. IC_218]
MTSRARRRVAASVLALLVVAAGCTADPSEPLVAPGAVPGLGAAAIGQPRPSDLDDVQPKPSQAPYDTPAPRSRACIQGTGSSSTAGCVFGDPDGDVDVAMVGNSKTLQWLPALDEVADLNGWRITLHAKSVCELTAAPTRDHPSIVTDGFPDCDLFNERMLAELTGPDRPDVLVTALDTLKVRQDDPALPAARVDALRRDGVVDYWEQVRAAGVEVVVLAATPRLPFDVPACLRRTGVPARCTVPHDQAYAPVWKTGESEAATREAGVAFVDLNDLVCPGATCEPVIGGLTVYRDRHHITASYMETLAPALAERLDGVLELDRG